VICPSVILILGRHLLLSDRSSTMLDTIVLKRDVISIEERGSGK
jgi:hypothetical protein